MCPSEDTGRDQGKQHTTWRRASAQMSRQGEVTRCCAGVTDGYHLLHPPGPQEISELILKHVNTRKLQLCWLGSMLLG